MNNVVEAWYFRDPFTSREEVEEAYRIIDSSTVGSFVYCPRYYEVKKTHRSTGFPANAVWGSAIHYALDYYYTTLDERASVDKVREYLLNEAEHWDIPDLELEIQRLQSAVAWYFEEWNRQKHDTYQILPVVRPEDLCLDDVICAKFNTTDDGKLILGECSLVMEFDVDGETMVFAGKPDLPVINQSGSLFIMDHKTTGGWLSSWYFKQFDADNKMRVYCAMMSKLLQQEVRGYVINALCISERAVLETFSGTRSDRREWLQTKSQIEEGVRNQWHWIKAIDDCERRGYFPQGCDRCRCPNLCLTPPEDREVVLMMEYKQKDHTFFDI